MVIPEWEEIKRISNLPISKWKSSESATSPRLKALELASKLRSNNGEAMTLKELTGKAEEILEWINK